VAFTFSEIRVSPIKRERTRALHDAHAFHKTAGLPLTLGVTCPYEGRVLVSQLGEGRRRF
jgi:hypothetical protein